MRKDHQSPLPPGTWRVNKPSYFRYDPDGVGGAGGLISGPISEAELEDLEECSEMFDFTGFLPEEDRRLLVEIRRLQAENAALRSRIGDERGETAGGDPGQ